MGDALGRKLGWPRELGPACYCARVGQQRGEVKGWAGRLSGLVGPRSRAGLGYEAFSSFLFFFVFFFYFLDLNSNLVFKFGFQIGAPYSLEFLI